jgi:DNA-binding response OmpR family regulator
MRHHKVIVVDSEPAICQMLGDAFDSAGFQGHFAASGEDAISALKDDPIGFAVALIDAHLPGLNAIDTASSLRAINPNIAIAFMAASGDAITTFGAKLYLKPFRSTTRLLASLQELLDAYDADNP